MTDIDIPLSAIAAKTDQISADDLKEGPIIARIERVTESDGQADREKQPHQVYLSGQRLPWRPCLTMRRLLVEMWGRQSVNKNWAGHTIKLVRDPTVHFGGEQTGGIRLVGADIDKRFSCLLPVSRGKRKTFVVEPIPALPGGPTRAPTVSTAVAELRTYLATRIALVDPPLTTDEKKTLMAYFGDAVGAVEHLADMDDPAFVATILSGCGRTTTETTP